MRKSQFRKTYRIRKKKSVFRVLKSRTFWFTILTVVFLGGIFYLAILFPKIQIKEIKISGNSIVSSEEIKKFIDESVSKKILFFHSKSILLQNLKEIKKDILSNYYQIESLNIKRKFPTALAVEIRERAATNIWCFKDSPCFNTDKNGIIFGEPDEAAPESILIRNFALDQIPKLGDKAIEQSSLALVGSVESKLKNMGIATSEFDFLPEARLNVGTKEGWQIYFEPASDIDWQMTKLSLVLEKEIPPQKRGNLEYIDLRFSKVYYKYR